MASRCGELFGTARGTDRIDARAFTMAGAATREG